MLDHQQYMSGCNWYLYFNITYRMMYHIINVDFITLYNSCINPLVHKNITKDPWWVHLHHVCIYELACGLEGSSSQAEFLYYLLPVTFMV